LFDQLYVPDPEFTDPNQTTVRNIPAAMLAGRMPQASQGVKRLRSRLGTSWQLRLPILAFAYVVLFFIAGSLVFPYVRKATK
jgi:hypothetical protein